MDTRLQIRLATSEDARAMAELIAALLPVVVDPGTTSETLEALRASLSSEAIGNRIRSGSLIAHLAELDGQLVGTIGVHDQCHLFLLFVGQKYQRLGIGRRLLVAALSAIPGRAGRAHRITVNATPGARAWYERQGFAVLGPPEWQEGLQVVPMFGWVDRILNLKPHQKC